MTISAYIVLCEDDEWKCLVHFHKKIDKLMQVGGHIELDETPWQTVANELAEETGYELGELEVLQYTADKVADAGNLNHPTPFCMNTHNVGNDHYHSDLCYGFVAAHRPRSSTAAGESDDLRWLTLAELRELSASGDALTDCMEIYAFLLDHIDSYVRVPAADFLLEKPAHHGITYKRGAPGDASARV
jgi:8-oxo-dGTP diphosphatase